MRWRHAGRGAGSADAPARPDGQRRRLLGWAGTVALAAWLLPDTGAHPRGTIPGAAWPQWQSFVARHIQADGRVVDFLAPDRRSTSESQSYALFFALCANDPALFARVLEWTRNQLAMGYLDQRLPAWLWGKAPDGSWKILDDNSASDADLWIAYALLEAGRLWKKPDYERLARRVLDMVAAQEVASPPGLGAMLLPGAKGFALPNGQWRLNPSYLPLQLLRRFADAQPRGPWKTLAMQASKLVRGSAPAGFVPDWIDWNGKAFVADARYGSTSSYDAIRVYLWAGMLDPREPLRSPLLAALGGPLSLLQAQGQLFEKVDTRNGVGSGHAPVGYAGAMLPYLKALQQPKWLASQLGRIQGAVGANGQTQLPYFERVLILFGQGWMEGRFHFASDGRLQPNWENT